MIEHTNPPPIEALLDRLAERGSRHLARAARSAAIADALTWAARSAVVVAAAALALSVTIDIGPMVLVAGWASLIGAVALGVYCWQLARQRDDRAAALALFDRALDMKDRATASAEFVNEPVRDGFRAAALEEAMPWVSLAIDAPPLAGPAPMPRRWWPFAIMALLLLAAALVVSRRDEAPDGATRRHGAAPTAALVAAVRRILSDGETAGHDTIAAGLAAAFGAPNGSGGGAADTPGGSASASNQRSGTAGAPGSGSRSATSGQQAGGAAGNAAGGAPPGSRGAGAGSAGAAGSAQDARADAAGEPGQKADTAARGADAADRQGLAAGRALAPPGERGGGAMPPSTPRESAASHPAGGNTGDRNQGGQNKTGQGGGKKGGQSGGQGQGQGQTGGSGSGRGAGQDAIKQTRGSTALLLAVPAEDRLIGTPNPGRVGSTIRPGIPRAAASPGSVRAQDRDGNDGDAGQILHAMGTPHDERVLRDYFRLRRGESVGAPDPDPR